VSFTSPISRRRTKPKGAPMPLYERIKTYVTDHISSGEWKAGDRVPSENELAGTIGASRLTVHRAFRELADIGVLNRLHGVGTFVAEQKPMSAIVTLHNIADEIRERGDRLSVKVHKLHKVRANEELAEHFEVQVKSELFHSLVAYSSNDVPVQLEDRYVSPAFAPDFLKQDFTRGSTTDYLQAIAMATEASMIIEAMTPTEEFCRLLEMPRTEPCLVVTRNTRVHLLATTFTRFYHPSSRHRIISHFDIRDGNPRLTRR
jgi:GntR family histidine utilization transcriptional repressor